MSLAIGRHRPIFLVDSSTRVNGTPNSFGHQLHINQKEIFDSVALISASIPRTYLDVNNINETFVLREGMVDTVITIPKGNYNGKSLSIQLQTLLNAASPNIWSYVVTFPDKATEANDGKLTFKVYGNGGSQPSLIFPIIDTESHEILGFETDSTNPFVGDVLKSPNVIEFSHTRYITIRSNIAHDGGNVGPGSEQTILARIYVHNTNDFEDIVYNLQGLEMGVKRMSTSKDNTYTFSIYDDHENLLDLNGHDWSATLMCFHRNSSDDIALEVEEVEEEVEQHKKKKKK